MPVPTTFAPQLSAGGGGPSSAQSSAGINTAQSNPFNFDHSGWVVNLHSNGASLSAQGSTGANDTSQAPSGAGGSALGGMNPMLILLAVGAYILLR